ncbi:hypothetical protein CEXT_717351 [Caerostris extrusa]|uniref:Ionotropic glutamate receptor L-glutamate and glycine-binding domain-containing protein n=1 Tax=Caerostris extrusa TaxID=172846 RepID=A0AAV4Y3Q9_CAEEX|nr:hypothetical protein CEXT_717351 [Caerostris extrusa]
MVRDNTTVRDNSRFYGFCIDLLQKIAERLQFEYTIELVPDRKYGAVDPSNEEWNGMVRELLVKVSWWKTPPHTIVEMNVEKSLEQTAKTLQLI